MFVYFFFTPAGSLPRVYTKTFVFIYKLRCLEFENFSVLRHALGSKESGLCIQTNSFYPPLLFFFPFLQDNTKVHTPSCHNFNSVDSTQLACPPVVGSTNSHKPNTVLLLSPRQPLGLAAIRTVARDADL
jgi:hypothetical protein